MKKYLRLLTICAVLIFSAGNVMATDYYVATTGNDGNDGSSGSPWLTIQHAINTVSSGDVINVASGTYNETVTFVSTFDKDNLSIIGDVVTKPVITGGILFQNGAGYDIDDLTLQYLYIKGVPSGHDDVIRATSVGEKNNFEMDNCIVDGEQNDYNGLVGNKFGGTLTITYCEFTGLWGWATFDIDASSDYSPNGGNGLEFTEITWTYNDVNDVDGSVALRGHYIDKTANVYVYNNEWDDIGGHEIPDDHWAAIEINHAVNLYCYNNTFSDVVMGTWEGQGIQMWDINTVDMYDNEFTDVAQGIYVFGGSAGGSYGGPWAVPGGSIYNNRFISHSDYAITVESTATGGPLDAENNWWGSANGPTHSGNTYNVGSQGNTVGNNVDYVTWLDAVPPGGIAFAPVERDDGSKAIVGYYSSIQSAIDAAGTGDQINVAAGTYNEKITVAHMGIEIKGAGAGLSIIDGTGLSGDPLVYFVETDDAVNEMWMHGFTLTNLPLVGGNRFGFRIFMAKNNGTVKISDNIVDCSLDPLNTHGIYASTCYPTGNIKILNNTINDCANNSMLIERVEGPTEIGYNTINQADGGGSAIYSMSYLDVNGPHNVTGKHWYHHNTINSAGSGGYGITIASAPWWLGSGSGGIYSDVDVSYNNIYNIIATGKAVSLQVGGTSAGIMNAIVDNNTFTSTSGPVSNAGINMDGPCDGTAVTNNSFSGFDTDVLLSEQDIGGTIFYPTNTSVKFNDLSTNTTYGVKNENPTETVDATCNWWGTTDPNIIQTLVSGDVNFLPFWISSTGPCNGLGPVVNTTQGTSFMTIQEAIDDVATINGDVIEVAAGTYDGNITVDKSLTIIGDPGDTQPGPGTNAVIIDGGSAPGSAFLIANGVTDVTIKGFEMRNFTGSGGIGNGISAWQASTSDITIEDNYFHNLGYNGVLVGNDAAAGDHTNWLIKNNIIENFGYIGFELTNASYSSIEDNVIHMNTPTIGAIFSSARRSETGLTIKNNMIDGTPSTLYPVIYIYAYDLDMPSPNLNSVLIEGNLISTIGTPYQIYIRNVNTGTVTNVTVNKNSLSTFKNGTFELIDASVNWWGTNTSAGVAASVSGSVDYTPWIDDGTDQSADTGYQPDLSYLHVDSN
ncbi:MAG: right-handed parallel beta-helix repeat-containing protein, partial [Bacteroidales bacterium]|nr:right-handed parallel beta-helix repeat-containing protein [Bacteroidales bacterium]